MLFTPSTSSSGVSATEGDSSISTHVTTPTVGISLPTSISFDDVLPTTTGATTTASTSLTITTTDSASYSLYLYADEDNSLKPVNPANNSSIVSTESTVSLSSLANNTWGYNLTTTSAGTDTLYAAVPTDSSTPIQTKDTSTTNSANDTYTLSFAAKVNTDLPSGTYSNTLTLAVVAEPKAITDITGLTYMQDMTPEVCAETEVGTTTRLTDKRDNKQYWVTKLADNNCWMTQNLDLDLSTSKALTPDDSDVSSNWTPTVSTTTSIFGNTSSTGQYSWDPGMYVKSDPDGYSNYCSYVDSLSDADCTSAGWTNVSSMPPMSDGTTNTAISGDTYNAHYLVGNYYQWNAATAGTGGSITSTNAIDSICPKGWQLPTSNNSNSGSFQALMNAYSISSNATGSTKITQPPLYFHPGGLVRSGSLRDAGLYGLYWSSTARSSFSNAYNLGFSSGYVNPSGSYYRYDGQSVRCLARQ